MPKTYQTAAAARFLTEHGRQTSVRTLQKYRLKAPGDPGEKGPRYFRDTATGYCLYREDDLLAWVREREARLVERAPAAKPAHLVAA